MGDKTGISWTDATWNPVRGCSRVSEGCRHCYAEQQAARIVRMGKGKPTAYDGLVRVTAGGEARWTGEVRLVPEHLADPLRWKKPRRVFVNSMSDLFHESLTNEQIAAVFGVMAAAPQHTFQVLTKRAKRMREWFEWAKEYGDGYDLLRLGIKDSALLTCAWEACSGDAWGDLEPPERLESLPMAEVFGTRWPLPNVWLGVSVENQDTHDERAEELLACPAAVYFFSIEPMLGPVDASQSLRRMLRTLDGRLLRNDHPDARSTSGTWRRPVDWVIAGCESGPGARPCSVEWLRSLRDQCAAAGVPFFLKQAVETDPGRCGDANNPNGDDPCGQRIRVFVNGPGDGSWSCGCTVEGPEFGAAIDVGAGDGSKRKPGDVIELPYLDGVQHAAFPEVRNA